MSSNQDSSTSNKVKEDEEVPVMPGFRFHPTDEELVSFYLRRKVEKRLLNSIELIIKQIDIYKYDPWDLQKASSSSGKDKEWYFFCKRGRKYRNSIRPNRVTGSGFWKATGIDKPVYSQGGEGHDCIGLKKTLVYYRGSAGKGTKTDWMMHEFRLPAPNDSNTKQLADAKTTTAQEAEIWTLCRIFKRNVSHRKYTPEWREFSANKRSHPIDTSSKTCSVEVNNQEGYINFGAPFIFHNEKKPAVVNHIDDERNQLHVGQLSTNIVQPPSPSSFPISPGPDGNEFFTHANWDDLRSVVEFALDPSFM